MLIYADTNIYCRPFDDLSLSFKIKNKCKIDPRDSIHLASAVIGKSVYFLTCDNGLLKKANCLDKNFNLKVINPIQFVGQIL